MIADTLARAHLPWGRRLIRRWWLTEKLGEVRSIFFGTSAISRIEFLTRTLDLVLHVVVVRTGDRTLIGQIASLTGAESGNKSPLATEMFVPLSFPLFK